MVIPSVPDKIERSKISEVLRGWDIDPDDLLHLEMTPRWIKAEVVARDSEGDTYAIKDRGVVELAAHELMIRIE